MLESVLVAQTTKTTTNLLRAAVRKATRIYFFYIAAYMVTVVAFDSWNLITHQDVSQRWTAAGILLIINTIAWYIARRNFSDNAIYTGLLFTLIISSIIFASFNVFWERGMASLSVALFAVPLITAAIARSRSTLLATASLCVAGYTVAAVRYFNLHYGEGFRIQLYATIGFYSAVFFVVAGLLLILIHPEKDRFLS